MTHCLDFYRKWKREQNFCGLRKQDAKDIDTYLSLVEKISSIKDANLDSDFVFDHFTAGAARPLIRCKDEETKTKALNYVIACLKRGEDVTGGDLQATIEAFQGKVRKESTQMRTQDPEPENVKDNEDSKPILSLAQQQAAKEPEVITDTYIKVSPVRDSPFKTAAQVMAHDKDPLGIDAPPVPVVKESLTTEDPAKILKEKRIQLAEDLLSCYSERFQMAARDHIRKETSWKNGAADFFYFGGEMLMDPPKNKPSSAGAVMRRS